MDMMGAGELNVGLGSAPCLTSLWLSRGQFNLSSSSADGERWPGINEEVFNTFSALKIIRVKVLTWW